MSTPTSHPAGVGAGAGAGVVAAAAAGADQGAPEATHLLAVCRTAEDWARVEAVAAELSAAAAAGPPAPPLLFHRLALWEDHPATRAPSPPSPPLPPHAAPAFDGAACSRLLAGRTRAMGRLLLCGSEVGSTQELLRAHGRALGDGAVAVADRQTSGKGRGGNQWTSPLGCLMFSALRRLRVRSPEQAPFINYLVCLAVTRGVREALQGLPPLDIRIKWPNDIYAAGAKIAGALIHTTWQGGCFNVITGIGLNVNNRQPTTCLDELLERAAAAAAAVGGGAPTSGPGGSPAVLPPVSREAVLAAILVAMEEVFDTFEQHGFEPLRAEYLAAWLHSRQQLDFDDAPSPGAAAPGRGQGGGGGRRVRLTVLGLSAGGFLLAEDEGGSQYELTPDGNSLDMMQGLIRRKVLA